MLCRHPVKRSLYLAVRLGTSATGFRFIGAVDFTHLTLIIFQETGIFYYIGAFQANLTTRSQPEELVGGILHEVVPLYKYLPAERNKPFALSLILRVVFYLHLFNLTLRVVGDDHLQRPEHTKNPWSTLVQILPDSIFQE